MNVDPARGRAFGAVGPVRGVDLTDTIAIHVARDGNKHRSQCNPAVVGFDREFRRARVALIHVHAAVPMDPRTRRANHKKMLPALCVAGYRAAEFVADPLALKRSQQPAVLPGIEVGATAYLVFPLLARRSHDHIGISVMIDITGTADVAAEAFIRVVRRE